MTVVVGYVSMEDERKLTLGSQVLTEERFSHVGYRGFESLHPLQAEGEAASGDAAILAESEEAGMAEMLTINEVLKLYAITRTTLYNVFKAGAPRQKVGPYTFVPAGEFRDWVRANRPVWLHPRFRDIQSNMSAGTLAAREKIIAANRASVETFRRAAKRSK